MWPLSTCISGGARGEHLGRAAMRHPLTPDGSEFLQQKRCPSVQQREAQWPRAAGKELVIKMTVIISTDRADDCRGAEQLALQ